MAYLEKCLGPDLYIACQRNDLDRFKDLTWRSEIDVQKWAAAALTAASQESIDVAMYCMQDSGKQLGTTDKIVTLCLYHEVLEPAYRFLVDSKLVHPDCSADSIDQLRGAAAGLRGRKRHSLVEYLLKKDVDPNKTVFMHGSKWALTAAAGASDQQMVELLLGHDATLNGSGALTHATEKGNQGNVEYLLKRGADVNKMVPIVDTRSGRKDMCSALHAAVENGHVDIVDMLLTAGADATLKDATDRTAEQIARTKGMDASVLEKLT